MKSNKQRRGQLKQQKRDRARRREYRGSIPCNRELLAPTTSYSIVDFVDRGYYVGKPFACIDCGKQEVWTATQQKWWYEVAKGDVQTTAVRCRACRRKERERKAEARRVHLDGLERKKAAAKRT